MRKSWPHYFMRTKNACAELPRRHSMKIEQGEQTSNFSRRWLENLKFLIQFSIHFHPRHPYNRQQTSVDGFSAVM